MTTRQTTRWSFPLFASYLVTNYGGLPELPCAPSLSARQKAGTAICIKFVCCIFRGPTFLTRAADSQSPNKRKRRDDEGQPTAPSDSDDAEDVQQRDEDDADVESDSDDEPQYTKLTVVPAARRGKAQTKGQPPQKRPRTTKATGSKMSKTQKESRPRAHRLKVTNGDFDVAKLTADIKISADNSLFSAWHFPHRCYEAFIPLILIADAVLNPAAALQSIAEDFLDSLTRDPGNAQAELINCILRACGCNDIVDADQVVDYDGVVDALDTFTEGLKQVRDI